MTLVQIVIVAIVVPVVLIVLLTIMLITFLNAEANEADRAPEPDDDDPLPVQRATFFTGRELAELRSTATPPAVVAGQDLDDSSLVAELQQAYADYRTGVDIFAGAPREVTG